MFSLEITCDPADRDLLIAELWDQGCAGIAELSPDRVRAFFEDDAARKHLLAMYPGSPVREEEKASLVPSELHAGERFVPPKCGKVTARFNSSEYIAMSTPPFANDV